MNFLIGLALFLILFIVVILWEIFKIYIIHPFKAYVLGERLYEYEKIPSHGDIIKKQRWCKSDEEALDNYMWYEFVECVYPEKHRKKLRPLN